jgi:hypothetical protein
MPTVSTPSSVPGMTVSVLSAVLLSLPSVVSEGVLSSETELVSVLEESLEELSLEHPTRDSAIMAARSRENVLFFIFSNLFFRKILGFFTFKCEISVNTRA